MGRKRGGLPLRKDLDNIQYLQSHPEIHQLFSEAGCLAYVEKLQEGYHQGITEAFAKSYDGDKATVSHLEMQVDEAAIASATVMPRIGQKWFKTTVTKEMEFRPYLKPELQGITWKRDIPTSHLKKEW